MAHFQSSGFDLGEMTDTIVPTLDSNNFSMEIDMPVSSLNNMSDSGLMNGDESWFSPTSLTSQQIATKKIQKTKKDPTEPVKPPSAYGAFFRDTQTAIKGQNPSATYNDVSKIVSSMWEVLEQSKKENYNRDAEEAKRAYIQQLSHYRTTLATAKQSPTSSSSPQQQEQSLQNQSTFKQAINNSQQPITNQTNISSKSSIFAINKALGATSSAATSTTAAMSFAPFQQHPLGILDIGITFCIHEGCTNKAVINPDWEDEYCSNECVIKHCQNIFSKWISDRNHPETFATSSS